MKKIKTLFVRNEANPSLVTRAYSLEVDPSWIATRKRDGTAIRILDGKVFRRFDAKHGKTPPDGFEPCQNEPESDGHFPGWVPIDCPAGDRTTAKLCAELCASECVNGTFELCGTKINGNAERLGGHAFFQHGTEVYRDVPTDFDGLAKWFATHAIEGIVWWTNHPSDGGVPVAKAKRRDFGLPWPTKTPPPESTSEVKEE